MADKIGTDGEPVSEFRFDCPRAYLDVIDAYAIANGLTRKDVGVQIARDFARHWSHVARVITNVTRGNPELSDSERTAGGSPYAGK